MNWINTTLGQLIDVKHGYAFQGEFFSDSGDYVLLTPGNCHEKGGLKLKGEKELYYTGDFPREYLLKSNDLLIVMTDLINSAPVLGGAFFIPKDNTYLHNQRLGLVKILSEDQIDKTFLYYLLNTNSYRGQVRGSASGATVKHTSPRRIKKCKVRIPISIIDQQNISQILFAYDNLINTNHRRIQLLEESAWLLFREWFMYFRFPGHEKVKVVDGVPEGWKKGKVKDLGAVVTGKTPSKKKVSNFNGAVPFIKTPDMHQSSIIIKTEESLSEIGADSQRNKYLPPCSILVSCIGTVGVVAMNLLRAQTNQQINSVIPKKEVYRYYSYFCLSRLKLLLEAIGGGSTMGNVNKNKFQNIKITIPQEDVLTKFHQVVSPIFNQIALLLDQNQKLAQARDLLLPRLMSGAIEV
jgi:type I restriction enzyme S subunit